MNKHSLFKEYNMLQEMPKTMKKCLHDISLTAVVAGMLSVILAFSSSSVLIFQSAKLFGLSQDMAASWIWAVSFGSGISGIFLSWKMKAPIIASWSTPGVALLISMSSSITYTEAICAYITSALITFVVGITGSLDVLLKKIPGAISAGLLMGILYSFCARLFSSFSIDPMLTISMFVVFLLGKRLFPRYAIIVAIIVGVLLCERSQDIAFIFLEKPLTMPVYTHPTWSLNVIIGVGIPLALVNLIGQYITGMAILHTSGFPVHSRGIMTTTSIVSLLLAPFGCHAVNLSSLSAAVCTGEEAHKNPSKRYIAGIACGICYCIISLFGLAIADLFDSLPSAFISVLAGIALLGAFMTGFSNVAYDKKYIEAGIITFLVTSSGLQLLGVAAPFWGLVFGGIAALLTARKKA